MLTLISLIYILTAVVYLIINKGKWLVSPAPLFVFTQLVFYLGTIGLLETSNESDRVHLIVLYTGLCSFIFGSILFEKFSPSKVQLKKWVISEVQQVENGKSFNVLIGAIILISILVSFLYYNAIGYNVFWLSMNSFFSGNGMIGDVATLRLNTYSGSNYFAPGYVNQFKNLLLPMLVLYLASRYLLKRGKLDLIVSISIFPLSLIFILGTGQRGAFVVFCMMAILSLNNVLPKRIRKRANSLMVIFLVSIFTISTAFLGRVNTGSQDVSTFYYTLIGLYERIFVSNQLSSVIGFRYIYNLPTQFGLEWIKSFIGILPGYKGSTLAHEIYSIMYGTNRGTAPVSIWGSIWYNFHALGIILVPFVMGIIYNYIFIRFIKGPKQLFRILTYSSCIVLLGTWGVDGPITLLNTGLISVIILRIITKVTIHSIKKPDNNEFS